MKSAHTTIFTPVALSGGRKKQFPRILKKAASLSLCISAVVILYAVPTHAITLTFEDLQAACDSHPADYPIPGGGTATAYSSLVGNGYGGLNWGTFYALDAPANAAYFGETANGNLNGLVSGAVELFNNFANPAFIQSTVPIVLHSAYLTGVWNDGLTVEADGYLGGVLEYSRTVTLSAYHATLVSYEFSDVDRVVWTSSGGTPVGFGGTGTHFAMDNLSYSSLGAVPDGGATVMLLGAAFSGLAFFRKRLV